MMSEEEHEASQSGPEQASAGPTGHDPLQLVRGQGIEVFDAEGNRYIDLSIACGQSLLGHNHPAVVQAIEQQASQLITPTPTSHSTLQRELSERLQKHLFPGNVAFLADASNANELALRYARLRHHGQRSRVITFTGSYHGLTLGALTASGQPYLQAELGPLAAGARYCPYGDLDATAAAIDEQTSAILIQPIQTRDGMAVPTPEFLSGLRQLADEHQLLLIFDESDLPIGCTGHWLAAQWFDVLPDCVTLAAGLAGGLPLAAVVLRETVAAEMSETLEHHPALAPAPISELVLAISVCLLDVIESQSLLENVQRCGQHLEQALQSLEEDFDFVAGVRCRGLAAGLELDVALPPLRDDLQKRGILVGQSNEQTLRLQLPLNAQEAWLSEIAATFRQAFEAVEREPMDA